MGRERSRGSSTIIALLIISAVALTVTLNMTDFVTSHNRLNQRSESGFSKDLVLRSALAYTKYALKNRWCMTEVWVQDPSCATNLTFALGHPRALERLLLTEDEIVKIRMIAGSELFPNPLASIPQLYLESVEQTVTTSSFKTLDFTSSNGGLGQFHPLVTITEGLTRASIKALTFRLDRIVNNRNPDPTNWVRVKIRVTADGSSFVEETILLSAMEVGNYALLMNGGMNLSGKPAMGAHFDVAPSASGRAGAGLHFLSPVFLNGNLILPDPAATSFTNVTFHDKVTLATLPLAEGVTIPEAAALATRSDLTPYAPETYGSLGKSTYTDIKNIGGLLRGIQLQSSEDWGAFFLFDSRAAGADPALLRKNMDRCILRNEILADLSLTNDSEFIIRKTTTEYTQNAESQTLDYLLGLSHGNNFYAASKVLPKIISQSGELLVGDNPPELKQTSSLYTRPVLGITIDVGSGLHLESWLTRESTLTIPLYAFNPDLLDTMEETMKTAIKNREAAESNLDSSKSYLDKKKKEYDAALLAYNAAKTASESSSTTLAQAKAAYDAALASLSGAETSLTSAQESLTTAKSAYDAANKALVTAKSEYDLALADYKDAQDAVTAATTADTAAQTSLATAQSDLEAAEALLAKAKNDAQKATAQADVDAALALVAEATAQLEAAKLAYNEALDKATATSAAKTEAEALLTIADTDLKSALSDLNAAELLVQKWQTAVLEAQSLVKSAAAALATAESDIATKDSLLAAAKKTLDNAKAALDLAQKDYNAKLTTYTAAAKAATEATTAYNAALSAQNKYPVMKISTASVRLDQVQFKIQIDNAGNMPGDFSIDLYACEIGTDKYCKNRRIVDGVNVGVNYTKPHVAQFVLDGPAYDRKVLPKYPYSADYWSDLAGGAVPSSGLPDSMDPAVLDASCFGTSSSALADAGSSSPLNLNMLSPSFRFGGFKADYLKGAKVSWDFAPLSTDLNFTDVTDQDFHIYGIVPRCVVKPTAKFVAGFLVCGKFVIEPRTTPLRIVGSVLTGEVTIDPSAIQAGIRWSTIYEPEGLAGLHEKRILHSGLFDSVGVEIPCGTLIAGADALNNPIWNPRPNLETRAALIRCSPLALRERADPFTWNSVDPLCGLVDETATVTTCKIRRPMSFREISLGKRESL
ncbi:MAG: hypothetical protein NDJ89_06970 [Oligoflexia bacterium]|nr:hypothetical protein [Oligoflexia bacterium]